MSIGTACRSHRRLRIRPTADYGGAVSSVNSASTRISVIHPAEVDATLLLMLAEAGRPRRSLTGNGHRTVLSLRVSA